METKPNVSGQFALTKIDFEQAFPSLRDVRNSAHHMEDRIRRLKTGNKPIAVQPTSNDSFVTKDQAMVLDSLRGNNYGTTLASGEYAEVEVSNDSMSKLQSIYQSLLDGLKWRDSGFNEPIPVIQ